jgi:hypothetical protein
MLIDFQYKKNGTLERMYCFKDGASTYRVVLHVHTREKWPGPEKLREDPTKHARWVTSANVRVAEKLFRPRKGDAGYRTDREERGHKLVGVGNWECLEANGEGHKTEWMWSKTGEIPVAEPKKTPEVIAAYEQVSEGASVDFWYV